MFWQLYPPLLNIQSNIQNKVNITKLSQIINMVENTKKVITFMYMYMMSFKTWIILLKCEKYSHMKKMFPDFSLLLHICHTYIFQKTLEVFLTSLVSPHRMIQILFKDRIYSLLDMLAYNAFSVMLVIIMNKIKGTHFNFNIKKVFLELQCNYTHFSTNLWITSMCFVSQNRMEHWHRFRHKHKNNI